MWQGIPDRGDQVCVRVQHVLLMLLCWVSGAAYRVPHGKPAEGWSRSHAPEECRLNALPDPAQRPGWLQSMCRRPSVCRATAIAHVSRASRRLYAVQPRVTQRRAGYRARDGMSMRYDADEHGDEQSWIHTRRGRTARGTDEPYHTAPTTSRKQGKSPDEDLVGALSQTRHPVPRCPHGRYPGSAP